MAKKRFKGRRVLVTGASSGIGRATAIRMAREGAFVLTTGRREEALRELIDEMGPECPMGSLAGDLRDAEFRQRLADTVDAELGGLDVLVNAAGIIASGRIEDTELEAFDEMMDINLRSVFDLTRRTLPHLVKAKGCIVNVSSTAVDARPATLSAYVASKAGVAVLTETLAHELEGTALRVNAIAPTTIDTPANRAAMPDADRSAWTAPETIAGVIRWLASDAAASVRGGIVPV